MNEVICYGSCALDVFVDTDAELINIKTPGKEEELVAYPLGSKILVKHLSFELGGSGANAAVSFARLGLSTAFLGMIGKDETGEHISKKFKGEGVLFVGETHGISGYSVVLDSQAEDRTILVYKGCNDHFSSQFLPKKIDAKWVYCSTMLAESWESMKVLVKRAHDQGVNVALSASAYLAT